MSKELLTSERSVFLAYEAVRQSGITNMFDTTRVSGLSGLTRKQIIYVIKNYDELAKKYLPKGRE